MERTTLVIVVIVDSPSFRLRNLNLSNDEVVLSLTRGVRTEKHSVERVIGIGRPLSRRDWVVSIR